MAANLARADAAPLCGGCGSDDMILSCPGDTVYGLCRVCERLQEVETRAEPELRPCDNCAYRPESPERADPWGWAEHRTRHVEGGEPFYCHKGLPITVDPRGFSHVIEGAETLREAIRKPCAGWLVSRLGWLQRDMIRRSSAINTGERE